MKEAAERHVLFEDGGLLRITAGDVDPRGWQLLCSDGGVFGTVTDLIADQETLRISHLVCDVFSPAPHRILLPTSFARFDQRGSSVIYDALTREEVDTLPPFNELPIDPVAEERVLALLTNDDAVHGAQNAVRTIRVVDRRKGERRHN